MRTFINFLQHLEKHNISYDLAHIRDDYIRVNIDISSERWKLDFSADGEVVVERIGEVGKVEGEEILEYLFNNFSI